MKSKPISRLAFPLASAIAALLASPSASAVDYFWDTNGATIGFGTTASTWAAPTPGPTAGWTTDSTGATAIGSITTSTSDNLFFGSASWIPSGTVTVSGAVAAGNLTFVAGTGITLNTNTINLADTTTINARTFGNTTINSGISGAATSLTKVGDGPLLLTGTSTYIGASIFRGLGGVALSSTGTINTTSGITLNGTPLTLTNTAQVERVNDSAGIISNGSTITYTNTSGANVYTETLGSVAITFGQLNFVEATNQVSTGSQTLTLSGLTRTGAANASVVTFAANTTGPQASGNKNMYVVTSAGTTTAGQIVGAWATTGTTASAQTDYATYNANYIFPASIAATSEDSWTTSTNAFTMTGGTTLTGTRTIAALRATGAAQTLALGSNSLETIGLLNGGSGLLTVSGSGALTTASGGGQLLLTSGSSTITVNAPINDNGGAVTLVKSGLSALTLNSTSSNYTGGTVVNAGILTFVNGALGTSGNILINGGINASTSFGRLQWAAGNTQDISSRLVMVNSGNANLDINGNNVTFASAIGSGSSSNLTKLGSGTLTLNANNTFTGETAVYVGTMLINVAQTNTTSVRVSNSTANGGAAGAVMRLGLTNALPINIPVMVDGQGVNTLDLNGFNQTVGLLLLGSNNGGSAGTVSGSGSTLTLTAGVTADGHNNGGAAIAASFLDLNGATQNFCIVGSNNATSNLTISSVIQNGGVTRSGSSLLGSLILSGANTYSGATLSNIGVIRIDNKLALQNSPVDTSGSGTVNLNNGAGIYTFGGLIGSKALASVVTTGLTNMTTLNLNPQSGNIYTYSGVIANGAMAVTKTGAGTQILSNNNTYTGGTNVNAGTLLLSGAFNMPTTGTLTVNAGGNFSLADGTVRDTTAAALNLATGALLTFDWSSDGIVDKLTSTAAATTTGNVGIRINPIGTPTGSGLTMLSAGSGLETAGGTKYFLANNIDYTATLTQSDTAVTIGNYATASSLTNAYWLGGQVTGALGAMALSSGTSSNWASAADGTLAGGVVPNGSTVNVIFGATGAAEQSNVTTGADMNLGSITFNDSAAVIVGGSNNITLNSASGTAASTTAALATVTPGSAISVTSFANAINSISANISMAASQTWNVASGKTLAVSGIVSGAFGLTKADAGTLALSGVNTYSGSTTLAAGILGAGESASLGNGGTSNILVFNGGSLQALGGITSPVTRGVMMTSNGSIDSNSFSVSIAGLVSGSGNLTKNGVGTLTFSGVNSSFSGGLTVANDTVILNNAAAAGTGTININTGAATNATVQTNGVMTLTNPITVTAGSIGTNTLTNTSHATSFSGPITANDNLTISNLAGVASVTVFAGGASVASGKTITLHTENSGGIIANGIITGDGKVATTSASSGGFTISGASNYTGGFTLGANVTHVISTSSTGADGNPTDGPFGAGTTAAILGTGSIRSTTAADTTIKNVISLAGDLTVPAIASEKSLIFTGPATLTGNRFFTVYMSDLTKSLAFLGAIGDGGSGYAFNKDGGGTMTFGGSNTYTGVTTVYSGTLEFAGGSQASPITVSSGASLGFTLGSPTTTTKDVDISLGTIKITGTPTLPSYDLITSSVSITGTPVLAAAIPGYELKVESNILKLKQAGYASWAAFNGASANLSDDHDNDGVSNGIEYFIGGPAGNTTGFTALPNVVKALDGTLSVTWTKAATYTGTYGTDFVVETSSSLTGTWTTEIADPNLGFTVTFPSATEVKFTFPSGPPYSGKNFARLKVTGP